MSEHSFMKNSHTLNYFNFLENTFSKWEAQENGVDQV